MILYANIQCVLLKEAYMRSSTVLASLLLVLMVATISCTSNNAQTNNKITSREKSAGTKVRDVSKEPQRENEIPLLLVISRYNKAQTEIVEEDALLWHWNIQTGSIVFEEKLLPLQQFTADPMWSENRQDIITLSSPPPGVPDKALSLYFSGSPNGYIELATYDDTSSKNPAESGRLILGDCNGSRERWRKINGDCPSLFVSYSPDVTKVGDKIYIDDKRGYSVKVIDLTKEPLKLVDYAPANELIRQVKNELIKDSLEESPLGFGSHQNILLVIAGGNTKSWIWAIQDDTCIGKIHINSKERKLVSYKDDRAVGEERLPKAPYGLRLPRK